MARRSIPGLNTTSYRPKISINNDTFFTISESTFRDDVGDHKLLPLPEVARASSGSSIHRKQPLLLGTLRLDGQELPMERDHFPIHPSLGHRVLPRSQIHHQTSQKIVSCSPSQVAASSSSGLGQDQPVQMVIQPPEPEDSVRRHHV
ncbi:hypothetical protein SAY86_016939 [Trapa natans]|uniref:Uncharacterized protein n=1 Tax=Trapa natans TaxID=22666 RepID=A0AAN7R603_TRANT|nr:hypothetical protein SAY86_016939 [Trapa natans]